MITPSFGLTATERVLPKLALDFTTASLDSRITFTRALNTATRVNSSGLIESVNADLPRFDYNPVTKVCKGLLIEESRVNLMPYSNDYSQTVWNKNRVTPSYDATVSPDGTQNADLFLETVDNGSHSISTNFGVTSTAGASHTISFFVKAAGRTKGRLLLSNGTFSVQVGAEFDLSNGTIGSTTQTAGSGSTGLASSISAFDSGWYRVSVSAVLDGVSTNIKGSLGFSDGSSFSYVGDVTKGMEIYGAQIEVGAFPTSYIPTEATTVTRNADVATMTGTNFSDWYNQTEGTLYCEGSQVFGGCYWSLDDGSNANRYFLFRNSTVRSMFRATKASSNILSLEQLQPESAGTIAAYKNGSFGFTHNGVAPLTSALANDITGLDRLNIGRFPTSNVGVAHIRKIMYWPHRLTNAELQAFTK
jgi:hypothetical protein